MHASGGPLSHAARNLRCLLRAPASWACALAALGLHGLLVTRGGSVAPAWWLENFGLSRGEFLTGKFWQVLTYGLLHGSWWHAVFNALFVLLVGSRIEHMAGPAAVLRTAALGILGGGLSHLLLGAGLLVGLSGGCFALLLLLTTLSPQSRMLPIPVSGKSLGLGILLSSLILTLMNPALGLPWISAGGRALDAHGMGSWFQIGHACHLGGGLAGWICGRWILRPRVTLDRLSRDRARREER
ncbi:MAG: rhomboid family intramembrane serine protease [Verrucomicrobiaceae bacterium]|nr:MAG: rhomboid family intramembrane serine protease [Verrucomicrobiaceae bacterium]